MSPAERPGLGGASFKAESLTAGYGEHPILHDVTVQTSSGEVVAVVGPNGAGKSTLLKSLTGELRPLSGRVLLDGEEVQGLPPEVLARRGVGYIPQSGDVFDGLRVAENLHMGGYAIARREVVRRIDYVLEVFPALRGLLSSFAGNLSGGERKMLGIARALVPDPRILLLDEPTAGLSPILTERLLNEHVTSLAALGKAVLLVEQKAEAALRVADLAYVLVGGEVAVSGPGGDILADPELGQLFLSGRGMSAATPRTPLPRPARQG